MNQAINGKLIAYVIIGLFAEIVLSVVLSGVFTKEKLRRGVMAQGMYRANTAIVGLPIAMELLGDVDVGPVIIAIAVAVPIFNIAAVTILEIFGGESTSPGKLLKGIVTNPLIIGTVVAILFVLLKIELKGPILSAVKSMSGAASPVLLFLVGAFFSFDKVSEAKKELVITTVFRLLVMPAIFLSIGVALGFRGVEFVALLTVFASSNAISSFTMAQQLGGDADLAGNIVVLTNLLCPFTLFIWSFLFKVLGIY